MELVGTVVSLVEREYDGYTNRVGREVPAGVNRTCWVVAAVSEPPLEINVRELAHFKKLAEYGTPLEVSLTVEARAYMRGDSAQVAYELRSLDVLEG